MSESFSLTRTAEFFLFFVFVMSLHGAFNIGRRAGTDQRLRDLASVDAIRCERSQVRGLRGTCVCLRKKKKKERRKKKVSLSGSFAHPKVWPLQCFCTNLVLSWLRSTHADPAGEPWQVLKIQTRARQERRRTNSCCSQIGRRFR